MIKLYDSGVYLVNQRHVVADDPQGSAELKSLGQTASKEEARQNTMAFGILKSHNTSGNMSKLKLKFDALASHDITYVGIIQTARAGGMTEFPLPYVLTNCHNSLCAVGGTINEDDHMFALSAAKKYGGIYVPPHLAVIHQYMREMMAGGGRMILGSDSHTRYGALGTMAVGEGGGELAKQLLGRTYDVNYPEVIAVYLTNKPRPGVGPQDIALAIIGKVFANGYVKNKVMEFIGDGIANLSVEYRNGIDVMTTETTCLSSIWETDGQVEEYLSLYGRKDAYQKLNPGDLAYYDGMVMVDLSEIRPMIALPFHPGNVYPIAELNENPEDILQKTARDAADLFEGMDLEGQFLSKLKADGGVYADQGVIAGCAGGTYSNICAAADLIRGHGMGNGRFALSVYPSSQPVYLGLVQNGVAEQLMRSGVLMRSAFCGPCFGAGDVPANGSLSIRHATRNFPNREGSRPPDRQLAYVALMDARSIAATALNNGRLTSATDMDVDYAEYPLSFEDAIYANRLYRGFGKADPAVELEFGPNITDWPEMTALTEHLLLKVACFITDPVTTTDELIPSGETSSYRSNPLKLAEFTLSRKAPSYVGKAKEIQKLQKSAMEGQNPADLDSEIKSVVSKVEALGGVTVDMDNTGIGSVIYAVKPGDGSAREQAASCQKVLGGWANIAREYATKRYRSNLINWGVLPFILEDKPIFGEDDYIFIKDIRQAIQEGRSSITAYVVGSQAAEIRLSLGEMTGDEKEILLAGCLINFYKGERKKNK